MANLALNKVILCGRVTADVELKQTPSGVSVCSFTLAVNRKYTKEGKQQADFITIVAWRQTAEFICSHFGRGKEILICGELQTRSWVDQSTGGKRNVTEVVASEVSFVGAKNESETNHTTPTPNGNSGQKNAPQYMPNAYSSNQPQFEEIAPDENLPF